MTKRAQHVSPNTLPKKRQQPTKIKMHYQNTTVALQKQVGGIKFGTAETIQKKRMEWRKENQRPRIRGVNNEEAKAEIRRI